MKTFFVMIIALGVHLYAQILYNSKDAALPTYIPQSKMSDSVKAFVKLQSEKTTNSIRKTVKRDALGRAIKDSISYVSKQTPQKIKVVIDYENLNHLYKTGFSGRYEISSNGREKKFWLNGKLLQEDAYFIEFKKNLAKQSEEVSPYRPPRVEYLTAEEIENLINGAGIVSIVEYKEPEMLSNDTTVGGIVYLADSLIRVQSQIQTNAFPLEYKGFGIGIYFTETGCPKTSYLNTTLYEQGNTCERGVRTHPTGVARILQTTAPQAKIYGFDQENYPDNPLSYSTPIYIGTHSWSISADSVYTEEDKKMDNYIYENKIIEFVAAGNTKGTTNYVTSPGKAVNAITVGAINPDSYTYASYSGWKNSSLGNQKPEVVNFTHFYFPKDKHFSITVDGKIQSYNGTFNGTSASTPYTAAMAGDVLSQHPFFKLHPEMFKALMMTGSTAYVHDSFFHGDKDNYSRIRKIPLYSKMA